MFLTIKLCTHAKTELFEIELIICTKMDLAFDNLQRLICHKTQTNKQTNIHLHTVKYFQVFLYNTNLSIFVQLKLFKYSYKTRVILFRINPLFAHI